MLVTNYSDARANLAALMDKATDDREEVRITRRGKPDVVLVAAEDFERWQEWVNLLRSPGSARALFESLDRAERGEGMVVSPQDLARMTREVEALAKTNKKGGKSETLERLIREAREAGTYGSAG